MIKSSQLESSTDFHIVGANESESCDNKLINEKEYKVGDSICLKRHNKKTKSPGNEDGPYIIKKVPDKVSVKVLINGELKTFYNSQIKHYNNINKVTEQSNAKTPEEVLQHLLQQGHDGFKIEHNSLMDNIHHNFNFYQNSDVLKKHRYKEIVCYEHTRIKLGRLNEKTDFIHANYVHNKCYIATQGPLPNTIMDFWQMIWEQDCSIIVMLNRTKEHNQIKCEQYWPLNMNESQMYATFEIKTMNLQTNRNCKQTTIKFTNHQAHKMRTIEHFQYLNWPDRSIPEASSLLQFQKMVKEKFNVVNQIKLNKNKDHQISPMVVHCSAGIGRTGTFIAIDIILEQIKLNNAVDVPRIVQQIRKERAFTFSVKEQYIFCYACLLEYAVQNGEISYFESDSLFKNKKQFSVIYS